MSCFLENTPHTIHISSILSNEGNEPTPVLWYWILVKLQDHFSLKNCSWSKSNSIYTVSLKKYLPHQTIFKRHGIQPDNHSYTASIHMLIFIHCSLIILLLKSIIVIFFIFHFAWTAKISKKLATYTVHRVVRKNLNYDLRVCRIFSCE